jgi:hypothetical protein
MAHMSIHAEKIAAPKCQPLGRYPPQRMLMPLSQDGRAFVLSRAGNIRYIPTRFDEGDGVPQNRHLADDPYRMVMR